MERLSAFSAKVKQIKANETGDAETGGASMYAEVYSGQVLDKDDASARDGTEDADDNWFSGKLKFRRHVDDAYRGGSDGRQVHDYEVIDPRAQSGKGGHH